LWQRNCDSTLLRLNSTEYVIAVIIEDEANSLMGFSTSLYYPPHRSSRLRVTNDIVYNLTGEFVLPSLSGHPPPSVSLMVPQVETQESVP
jgi:hypothetical protein